jgi:hypothetical protein
MATFKASSYIKKQLNPSTIHKKYACPILIEEILVRHTI